MASDVKLMTSFLVTCNCHRVAGRVWRLLPLTTPRAIKGVLWLVLSVSETRLRCRLLSFLYVQENLERIVIYCIIKPKKITGDEFYWLLEQLFITYRVMHYKQFNTWLIYIIITCKLTIRVITLIPHALLIIKSPRKQ